MALTPEQISSNQRSLARCSGERTNAGAQKSGVMTAKYTAACASPPMNVGVEGWKSMNVSRNLTANTSSSRATALADLRLKFHHAQAAKRDQDADHDGQADRLRARHDQMAGGRLRDDEDLRKPPRNRCRP